MLNRGNGGQRIFDGADSYDDFLAVMENSGKRTDMRILAYCLMPNHWHLLLWPREDGDLARFVHRFATTHAQRWHARHGTAGRGHLYQGRFKSFIVDRDAYLTTVCRYIERNPLRSKLVSRAEYWAWSSLRFRERSEGSRREPSLTPMPVDLPRDWLVLVNEPQTEAELAAIRGGDRNLPAG